MLKPEDLNLPRASNASRRRTGSPSCEWQQCNYTATSARLQKPTLGAPCHLNPSYR